jgi:adenylosuccinate lyase
VVQEQAMKVWKEEKEFKALLLGSEEVMKILSPKELNELFDPKRSLKHIEYIFEQVGIH